MQWLKENFLSYLQEWEEEAKSLPLGMKHCLSRETLEGMRITSKCETIVFRCYIAT